MFLDIFVKNIGRKSEFSLIKLMIVVVIIGILAAVAIPSYKGFQDKAKAAEAKTVLGAIYSAQAAFYAEWNSYTGDLETAGLGTQTLDHYGAIGFSTANTVTKGGSVATTSSKIVFVGTGLVNTTAQLDVDCNVGTTSSLTFVACAQRTASTTFKPRTDWQINQARALVNTAP